MFCEVAGRKVVLASGSARRRGLFELAGLDFEIVVPDVDENLDEDASPERYICDVSRKKAHAAVSHIAACDELARLRGLPVIAADTAVVLDGVIYGKPKNAQDATRILGELSGRTHNVITGVTIVFDGEARAKTFSAITDVVFHELTEDDIGAYVATDEPYDKAGAYGIQGAGGLFVKEIRGDYYNVVGLPIGSVLQELSQWFAGRR